MRWKKKQKIWKVLKLNSASAFIIMQRRQQIAAASQHTGITTKFTQLPFSYSRGVSWQLPERETFIAHFTPRQADHNDCNALNYCCKPTTWLKIIISFNIIWSSQSSTQSSYHHTDVINIFKRSLSPAYGFYVSIYFICVCIYEDGPKRT